MSGLLRRPVVPRRNPGSAKTSGDLSMQQAFQVLKQCHRDERKTKQMLCSVVSVTPLENLGLVPRINARGQAYPR